ncbi:hypothetical protein DACRYDRAFT_99613 [Dacryopinax primogenitus]|uniref:Ubiquitin 3 binding protein But2 C-terminal domain-containing protein n=1 Tax=Dacryopinax primogenitus (strain DJM 731) TaxID=1858805 RepID=M5GBC3_DACPD|nr:uncharacterized protein DACRYDRAFT_99613 [Dacryopinax primogenitus]EJU03347.1 hypothetical protein DACRYDRAFT_99613 [Dacryopinax primogenitus]
MPSDKAEYMPLQPTDTSPENSDGPDLQDDAPYTPSAQKHALVLPPLLLIAFLAALGSTMLNVSLLPLALSALQSQRSAPPRWPEPTYEPNKVIGLEKAPDLLGAPKEFSQTVPWHYKNGSRVDVNVVFPSVVAHLNASDAERVYSEHSAGRSKKFVLTRENSMLLQYTNLDPTKHTCTIVGFRPSSDLTVPRPYTAEGEINVIEVWNLTRTGSGLLDPQTLSYNHRPPRGNYIGNIDFRMSPNSTTNKFLCPVGEADGTGIVSVEFRCQRWECKVELDMLLEQDGAPRLGFELAQWNEEK